MLRTVREDRSPGVGRLYGIATPHAVDVWITQLQWVMDDIATKDRGHAIALRVDDQVAFCVSSGSADDNTLLDLEPIVYIFY